MEHVPRDAVRLDSGADVAGSGGVRDARVAVGRRRAHLVDRVQPGGRGHDGIGLPRIENRGVGIVEISGGSVVGSEYNVGCGPVDAGERDGLHDSAAVS